jgi:anaerobic magnesium-protoporphyrin IX monomethyl ester cyclase
MAEMRYLFPLNPYNQQRQFEKPVWVYPAHLAMYATYLRARGHEVHWGVGGDEPYDEIVENDFQIDVPFEELPFPDRRFTDALNKRWQDYGNYKFHPATHMMSSNLCWYGKCTFCIDTVKLEKEKRGLRTVEHCLEEVEDCARLGIREIFDDSGTFPIGNWLRDFCVGMIKHKLNTRVVMGCNMRVQDPGYWRLMKAAGFRFVLMGIESANQITLDNIKKSQKADEMVSVIKAAADAGLEPHGTFMTGYPWETEEDEKRTIALCQYLLRKGYLKTAQASVYSLPRTPPDPLSAGHRYLPRFFDVYKSPEFLFRKVADIRRWEDFTYLLRGARLVVEEKVRKACLKK